MQTGISELLSPTANNSHSPSAFVTIRWEFSSAQKHLFSSIVDGFRSNPRGAVWCHPGGWSAIEYRMHCFLKLPNRLHTHTYTQPVPVAGVQALHFTPDNCLIPFHPVHYHAVANEGQLFYYYLRFICFTLTAPGSIGAVCGSCECLVRVMFGSVMTLFELLDAKC